ncbi:SMR family transporter [Marinobacter sp. M1N3S26]|uniref:SMR family transporter n=1 Tax=unclassified Marinobacter TaxID=83889 RepID=UPI00387A86E5
MKNWLFLGTAIMAEVVATSSLKASVGFTRFWPSVIVVIGYAVAFYFLALTLKAIPVGIAYAIWAGLGIVLITLIGWLLFGQKLDPAGVIGMGLIVAGVVVINVFSKGSLH